MWWISDRRLRGIEYQLLRLRGEQRMAWADIKAKVDELKAKYAKLDEDLMAVRSKLVECMKKESVEPAEMEAVKADLDAIISDIDDNLHTDGM